VNAGEGFLIKMNADDILIYNVPVGEKLIQNKDSKCEYFKFENGNPAEAVYTMYIEGLDVGDEIAAYDGDIMVGSLKINSSNVFENELPVFGTLIKGQGYATGHKIIIKVLDNKTKQIADFDYEFLNPYDDAYTSEIFPNDDGKYSILNFSKNISVASDLSKTINIYPNPAKETVNIVSENIINKIEIFNISGQNISSSVENSNNVRVDVEDLSQGVYLVKIHTFNNIIIKRFTIK